MQRRHFEQIRTFPERLSELAHRLREQAQTMRPGKDRDSLLQKARQADTAAHIDEWVSSPGLQAPK
ncbi:hypothetical protein [Bradyrhizobium sp. NP1]|uniref:hypothetical protein n=1 Tax=Bradyrhizobium sp. NP1 TaxID=3049772 RepID=UPI0025A57735|nr:hypothetical protein [Bradyrhizobium sp. NP1]WJR77355.1 hypothetical protein QOU61_32270 [Bradyrhizobium sp. NP1]